MIKLPEPYGYIIDGHPDGLRFRKGPLTGIEALVHSSAPVFSAEQMKQVLEQQQELEIEIKLIPLSEGEKSHNWCVK